MRFDPFPAAFELQRHWHERLVVGALPASIAPRTEQEGVMVQHTVAALLHAIPPAGFKIGATGRRMQDYLGIKEPIAGFMRSADIHRGPTELPFAHFLHPGVECEVAVRLAHDLPAGPCTLDQARAAVGGFFAGIEIVENRYDSSAKIGMPLLLADQMYHAAAVIGDEAEADWHGLDLAALRGHITLADGPSDEGVTADLLGHPLNGLAWLAASPLAAAFGGLKAGQVVMLGSVTPPIWLDGPARVTVSFPPLPAVTLTLT